MAKVDDKEQKQRPLELVASMLSVASAIAVFNFAWNFRSSVEAVVSSHVSVLKPSREYIQSTCDELVREERKRSREEHAELREAINWIMRNLGKERPR